MTATEKQPDPNRIGTLPRQILEQRDARIHDLENFLKASQDGQAHYQARLREAEELVEGQNLEIEDLTRRLVTVEDHAKRLEEETHALAEEKRRLEERCRRAEINLGHAQDATRLDAMEDCLHQIRAWVRAYPIKQFPEPPWNRVRHVLEAEGITLDSVSASNMRHVCDGIARIIDEGLK